MPRDSLGLGIGAALGAYRGLRQEPQQAQPNYNQLMLEIERLRNQGGSTNQPAINQPPANQAPQVATGQAGYGAPGAGQGFAPQGTNSAYYNQFGYGGGP